MIRFGLLLLLYITAYADLYDEYTSTNLEHYDDAWMGEDMEVYKNDKTPFKHVQVKEQNFAEGILNDNDDMGHATSEQAWEREDKEALESLMISETMSVNRRKRSDEVKLNTPYQLTSAIKAGLYIDIHGVYSNKSTRFTISLRENSKLILLHIVFVPEKLIQINSALPNWGQKKETSFPAFENGKKFKFTIMADDTFYRFFFNGKLMPLTFPYRKSFEKANYLQFAGNNIKFTHVKMPDNDLHPFYKSRMEFQSLINGLKRQMASRLLGKKLEDIVNYANSTEGTIDIFSLELLSRVSESGKRVDVSDEHVSWIIHTREVLEMLMTSGDILNNNWKKAIEILAQIMKQDPNAKKGLKLRLAVATALSFAYPVRSLAVWNNFIDGVKRYHQYAKWADEQIFFSPFYEGTAWHLRYVVSSWQTDEELEWARENILPAYQNPSKVADVTHRMVKYKLYNNKGVSIHAGRKYYDYKPLTLAILHEYGAVCGGISRFAVGMSQAHGVPATLVGQPGHCAYIWYKNKKWVIGNDVSGWYESTTHAHIQYTWKKPAPFFVVMEKAQMNLGNYQLSEKIRLISKYVAPKHQFVVLEAASTISPYNYGVWMDMESALVVPELSRHEVHASLLNTLEDYRKNKFKLKNVALSKPVSADCNQKNAHEIVKGGNVWTCGNINGTTFEIDLQGPKAVKEVKIWWWGSSKAKSYTICAADRNDSYTHVASQVDEKVKGSFNAESTLLGWPMRSYKIKFSLKNGKKDPWGYKAYFGIRRLAIYGTELDENVNVGSNKPVFSNHSEPSRLNDGDSSTVWTGSAFSMDLLKLTAVNEIILNRHNNSNDVEIEYGIPGKTSVQHYNSTMNTFSANRLGSLLKVSFNPDVESVNEVFVHGVAYSVKEILKVRIRQNFKDIGYVKDNLQRFVDKINYKF